MHSVRLSLLLTLVSFSALLLTPAAAHDNRSASTAAASEPHTRPADALYPPLRVQTHSTHNTSGTASQYQPSAFMAGQVAVQVVFVESDGRAEPSLEDWTLAQISTVTAQAQAALDWWQAQLPHARLSFALSSRAVPSAYEPITHGLASEYLWIGDALTQMGFPGTDYFEQAYAADQALRAAQGTDWATTIFVVNSAVDPDGRFADQLFAYAYINGPFMVITSDSGPYGATQLAAVIAHEMGHLFGALDQYVDAGVPCSRSSGYLDIPTTNSQFDLCGTQIPSIMITPTSAYQAGQIDNAALGQVGYRDSDGDNLPDPLDTAPVGQMTLAQPAPGKRPSVQGRVIDQPYESASQPPMTINTVSRVEYRADGSPWHTLPAADGAYDSADEALLAPLPLYDGQHDLELRAFNSLGAVSDVWRASISVSGVGADPGYQVSAPSVSNAAEIDLRLSAPTSDSVQISRDISFNGASWQPVQPTLAWRIGDADGDNITYVRFRSASGLESPIFAVSTLLDQHPPDGAAFLRSGSPPVLQLDASDSGSGIAALQITLDDGSISAWQAYQSTVELPAGTTAASVQLRDAAGNVSTPLTARPTYLNYLPLMANT